MSDPYPGAKQITIPINKNGKAFPPENTDIGPQYTAIEFSALTGPTDPTVHIERIEFFADQTKKDDVTLKYFPSQESLGDGNRICTFNPDLKVPPAQAKLWYEVFYSDGGHEHDTDPTVTIDPRGN